MMDAYQSLGMFVVIIMFLLGSAGTLLCAGYGAWMIKKQWESGFDWVSPPNAVERERVDLMDATLRQRDMDAAIRRSMESR